MRCLVIIFWLAFGYVLSPEMKIKCGLICSFPRYKLHTHFRRKKYPYATQLVCWKFPFQWEKGFLIAVSIFFCIIPYYKSVSYLTRHIQYNTYTCNTRLIPIYTINKCVGPPRSIWKGWRFLQVCCTNFLNSNLDKYWDLTHNPESPRHRGAKMTFDYNRGIS